MIDQIEIPRFQKYIQSIPGSIPDIGSEMLGKQIYRYSFGINHVGDRYLRVRHREQIIGRKESSSSKRPIPVRDILQGTQFVGKRISDHTTAVLELPPEFETIIPEEAWNVEILTCVEQPAFCRTKGSFGQQGSGDSPFGKEIPVSFDPLEGPVNPCKTGLEEPGLQIETAG